MDGAQNIAVGCPKRRKSDVASPADFSRKSYFPILPSSPEPASLLVSSSSWSTSFLIMIIKQYDVHRAILYLL